jgi:hypothetical protein
MKTFVLVISVWALSFQASFAAVLTDNFDDNSMSNQWAIGTFFYNCSESDFALSETNQRLEYSASLPPVQSDDPDDWNCGYAFYYSNQWWLDVNQDFSFKISYHHPQTTGGAEMLLGIAPSTVNVEDINMDIYLSAECWEGYKDYAFWNKDGEGYFEDYIERTTDDGTLYISYDASADELYLSYTGYGQANAWQIVSGVLKGHWNGVPIYLGFGGCAYDGTTVSAGSLYLDDFVLDEGAVVTLFSPTGVSATGGAYTDKVAITWTASSGATAYDVYRNTSNNSASSVQINVSDVAGTSYDDTSAVAGTTYWYWVKAKNAGGASGFSAGDSGYRLTVTATTFLPDFNGDGKTDILWRNTATGSCLIQLMNGTSTISRGTIGGDLTWEVAGLGDFNNDGKTDILWRKTTTGSCLIQLMNGVSTMSRGTVGGDLTWEPWGPADFNGDNKADILWRKTTTGSCLIQLMNGVSTISRGTVGGDLTWEPWGLGDFNHDHMMDILWCKTTTGSCLIQLMNGVSTISRGTVGGDLTWGLCDIGDFNYDNKSDILWRKETTGSCLIQLMNGVSTISRGAIGGDLTWNVEISGDFNDDHMTDILWRKTTTGSCLIQLMNGTSTISRGTVGGDLTWEVLNVGDFNGDQKADIFWRKEATGSCLIQLMNGTSTISRGTIGGDLTWEPIAP